MSNNCRFDFNFLSGKMDNLINLLSSDIKLSIQEIDEINSSIKTYQTIKDLITKTKKVNNNLLLKYYYQKLPTFYDSINSKDYDRSFYFSDQTKTITYNLTKIKFLAERKLKRHKIDDQTVVDSISGFFQALDIDLYKIIKNIDLINPTPYHFIENFEDYGNTLFDTYHKVPYMIINKNYNIVEFYSTAHELSHTIDFMVNGYQEIDEFDEVIPYTIEMILSWYFYKKDKWSEEIHSKEIMSHNSIIEMALIAHIQFSLYTLLQRRIVTIDDLKNYANKYNLYLLYKAFSTQYQDNINILHSYLIATNLFNNYYQNQEKTLEDIKKLFFQRKNNNTKDILSSISIDPYSLNINDFNQSKKVLIYTKKC